MRDNFSPDEIERAKTDTQLFAEVFRRFAPRIFSYLASRIPTQSDAEELSGQIWEQVVKSLPKFKPVHEGSFPAWLFRIARNKLTDFYRKKKLQTVSLETIVNVSIETQSPTEELKKKEVFVLVVEVMAKLPKKQREAVELKYFSDLKNKEIAAVLKVDERTVASNLSRAVRKMHGLLDSDAVKLFSERYIK